MYNSNELFRYSVNNQLRKIHVYSFITTAARLRAESVPLTPT